MVLYYLLDPKEAANKKKKHKQDMHENSVALKQFTLQKSADLSKCTKSDFRWDWESTDWHKENDSYASSLQDFFLQLPPFHLK